MPREPSEPRRVCFVTGTRAEFGLMRTTLTAIDAHPKLQLQLVVTGMHLDGRHGRSVDQIRRGGWFDRCDVEQVPWRGDLATATGRATAGIGEALGRLRSDVVLVVGDRVEAFAGATAGHLGGRIVAHVHGGDRALGQVDDALRHAISKLAHVHFPATAASAGRLRRLGEDRWRIQRVGSPGIDGIASEAAKERTAGRFALVVLHPIEADDAAERRRAEQLLAGVLRGGVDSVVIVYPNNDPGAAGVIACWGALGAGVRVERDLPRARFLGLLRDAAVLVGNSSSGIIEAASFGTPVVDVGARQRGRECGENVAHVEHAERAIAAAVRAAVRHGRFAKRNLYGGRGTGRKIAEVLASVRVDQRLRRKLIAY